ncbi:DoxX family protein [Candidatus Woesearchaeota archaeon]|nr:MAG: DoxX family protein [Candidatus Woesearchaeota archaeon]
MNKNYAPTLQRAALALIFLVAGIGKLMHPSMIIDMLAGMGFPLAAFFGWLVIAIEVLGGLSLLLGWKVEYSVWPMAAVLFVALVTVHLGKLADPMGQIIAGFHVLGITSLISLYLSGPGEMSVSRG